MRERSAYIFPDGDLLLVQGLRRLLLEAGEDSVRVSTRKASPQEIEGIAALSQVVVRSDGGTIYDRFAKDEEFGINIYTKHPDPHAAEAKTKQLALLVEAVAPLLPGRHSPQLKHVELNGSTEIEKDGGEAQRYLRFSVTILGSKFNL